MIEVERGMVEEGDSMIWRDAEALKCSMISDGWRSPDTYDNYFESAENFPAVYMFCLFDRSGFEKTLIAYVGMSTKLRQRWASHNIMQELYETPYWPQRWFIPVEKSLLRETESKLIQQYDPPWNTIGRRRGIAQ